MARSGRKLPRTGHPNQIHVVSGGAVTHVQPADTGSLDVATDLDSSGETHLGLDVGAMAVFGRARVGVMVRNVNRPEFGSGTETVTLRRQARVGAAMSSGSRGVIGSATLAVDADLTTTATLFGDERRLAFGGEVWTPGRTFGVRGGVNVNTIGTRRTGLSAGLSAAVKKGLYADGEVTGGTNQGPRGWAAGLRVTF